MKYIFDFDDVLFHTKYLREHRDSILEKAGILRDSTEEYFKNLKLFSLKELLAHFSVENLYQEIMSKNKDFINTELIEMVKKLGKENCFIVSYGDAEFQMEKINSIGITSLFSKIIIVSDEKKENIEKICDKYKNERVFFIDDKTKHFENLDLKKYPNLKTILYTGQNIEPYLQ